MRILIFNQNLFYCEDNFYFNPKYKIERYLYINSYFIETTDVLIYKFLTKYFNFSIIYYINKNEYIEKLFSILKLEYQKTTYKNTFFYKTK